MKRMRTIAVLTAMLLTMTTVSAVASPGEAGAENSAVDFWTPERVSQVEPRDLVLDHRGLAYLALSDGRLQPYGHQTPAVGPPDGKGPGNGGGGGGGGGAKTVRNAEWTFGGDVQTAAGRILFEMPDGYFVCSGTAVADGTAGRSVILTAAHCVYDDVNKVFAQNVLFIPNQAETTGAGTDFDCTNDPLGCFSPSHGVVDVNWTTNTFPDNIPWDYGYYVTGSDDLENAAGTLSVSFGAPTLGAYTHALGYSYSDDPNFMYCAESMGTVGADNYWLSKCGMSGGSSGGPWVQPMDTSTGSGPVISVNSWGYRGQPGMAGPLLAGTSASDVFQLAKTSNANAVFTP